jgi:hypothetical protein
MVVYDSVSGNFMSFGGYTSGGLSNSVRSTPASTPSPTWNTSYALMPAARYGHSGGIWNRRVYCWAGGLPSIAVYDIATNSWVTRANTTTIATTTATIDTENGIMYIAAWVGGDTTMSVYSCNLNDGNPSQYIWTKLTSVLTGPALRNYHTLSYYNGVLYMVGGRKQSTNTVTDEMWAYNIAYGTWIKLTLDNAKVGTEYASAEVIGDKIYVIGGNLNNGSVVSDFHDYDLTKNHGMALRLMRT